MSKLTPLLETLFMNKGGQPDLWIAISKVANSKPDDYIKTKLLELDTEVQELALDVLDYLMTVCKIPMWTQVASKAFLTTLINIVKTRDAPEVQAKILYLIKKWGIKFESQKEILPNFFEIFQGLKKSGVVFPDNVESDFKKYLGEDYSPVVENKKNTNNSQNFNNISNDISYNNEDSNSNKGGSLRLELNPEKYDKKYSKILPKLKVLVENINLANEIIDNLEPGTQPDEWLKAVIDSIRPSENEIMVYIQDKVKDEKLLEILLGINDDLVKTISRYDQARTKKKPSPFVSVFGNNNTSKKSSTSVSSNQTKNNNIIDLFGNDSGSVSNQANNKQQIPIKNVDEIFNIFSNPQPINQNIPTNNSQDPFVAFSNFSNTGDLDAFKNSLKSDNISLGGNNSNQPSYVNPNSISDKRGVDLITDKLKNAYIGGSDNSSQFKNVDFTMMNKSQQDPNQGFGMGMNNINNMNPMNLPGMNMNMNSNQSGFNMMNPNSNMQNNMYPNLNPNMSMYPNANQQLNQAMNQQMNFQMNQNMPNNFRQQFK